MDSNVKKIIEKIDSMSDQFQGVYVPKSLSHNQVEMTIDEFDEAVKDIQAKGLLGKLVLTHENNKIIYFNIPGK